ARPTRRASLVPCRFVAGKKCASVRAALRPQEVAMRRGGRLVRAALSIALALGAAACGGDSDPKLPNPAPPATTEVSGLAGPEGLTFDSNGVLYVGTSTGSIVRVFPEGFTDVFFETGRELAG